jgi:hypothetical protein
MRTCQTQAAARSPLSVDLVRQYRAVRMALKAISGWRSGADWRHYGT